MAVGAHVLEVAARQSRLPPYLPHCDFHPVAEAGIEAFAARLVKAKGLRPPRKGTAPARRSVPQDLATTPPGVMFAHSDFHKPNPDVFSIGDMRICISGQSSINFSGTNRIAPRDGPTYKLAYPESWRNSARPPQQNADDAASDSGRRLSELNSCAAPTLRQVPIRLEGAPSWNSWRRRFLQPCVSDPSHGTLDCQGAPHSRDSSARQSQAWAASKPITSDNNEIRYTQRNTYLCIKLCDDTGQPAEVAVAHRS